MCEGQVAAAAAACTACCTDVFSTWHTSVKTLRDLTSNITHEPVLVMLFPTDSTPTLRGANHGIFAKVCTYVVTVLKITTFPKCRTSLCKIQREYNIHNGTETLIPTGSRMIIYDYQVASSETPTFSQRLIIPQVWLIYVVVFMKLMRTSFHG